MSVATINSLSCGRLKPNKRLLVKLYGIAGRGVGKFEVEAQQEYLTKLNHAEASLAESVLYKYGTAPERLKRIKVFRG